MDSLARFALADDDGWTWLRGFPAGSADAVVIAPPGAADRQGQKGHAQAQKPGLMQNLAWDLGRVLAKGRRGFWICESRYGLGIARLLERFGLEVAPPIIWDRGEDVRGRLRWILPVSHGRARGLPSLPDLIVAPGPSLGDAIAELLVMTSSLAGQWVLEPFATQPALATASIRLGRSWAGASRAAEARGAIATRCVAIGARAGELPMRWDPSGVPVRAGSALASQLAFLSEGEADGAALRGPTDTADDVRTSAL